MRLPDSLPAADSWVLRKGKSRTPPGPEGSNGTDPFPVPQGCLAIIRRAALILRARNGGDGLTSGSGAQMAPGAFFGSGRAGVRDAYAGAGAQQRAHRSRLP